MEQPKNLSQRAIKTLVESDPISVKQLSFYLQVLNLKEFDNATTGQQADQKKTVRMRCLLSDGETSVVAMMNK